MSSLFPADRTIIGSLCYLIRDGQVLLLKRTRPPHVGLWSPPGGKMQVGESPQDCVVREIWEETGLRIEQPQLRAVMTVVDVALPVHWLLFVFRAEQGSGTLVPGEEGELQWIDLKDIHTFPRPESDAQVFPHILSDAPILQIKFVYDTPQKLLEQVVLR